jgi:hypothetical protein
VLHHVGGVDLVDLELDQLVRELWSLAVGARPAVAFRAYLRERGLVSVPFGDGDQKTASPGTYRPVGATCPRTCPYLGNGCYAEGGNVALHQRVASADRRAALVGAAVVMVWAARTDRTARLHVSGDMMGPDGKVDHTYVHGLTDIARTVRELRGGDRPVAWTYTHATSGPWVELLREAGVAVRLSDRGGEWGAVVVADREGARLRRGTRDARGRFQRPERTAVCPAQLGDTDCASCKLCWSRPDVTIAFLAHGNGARKVRATIGGAS